nr:T9SS type A sorting domain-containing protein [Bacteroidota bacterium]
MKNHTLIKQLLAILIVAIISNSAFAQWVPVNSGLPDFPPTSMFPFGDTMVLSTYGGGLFMTYDDGENWSDINGDLGNLYVNDIRSGETSYVNLIVSTVAGPYLTPNTEIYINCNGTGLTNTDVNFFWSGNEAMLGDFFVGTNGSGVFAAEYTTPFTYDWSEANVGISGDGYVVNDGVAGYSGFGMIATDGGMYWVLPGETQWTEVNSGLSGDALKVQKISYLGELIIIATHGGLYYSLNLEENWLPIIPDEKLNIVFYLITDISPTNFMLFAFGENGYYSEDMETWTQMDFSGMEGEVTAAQATLSQLYLGFTTIEKSGKGNGGIYRKPLEQFLVGIESNEGHVADAVLEQNFPNPCKDRTKISYSLSHPGNVCIKVLDVFGREIEELLNMFQTAGQHTIIFKPDNLPQGVYFYTLQVGSEIVETRKMMIRK